MSNVNPPRIWSPPWCASLVSGEMTDKGVHHVGHPRGFTRISFRLKRDLIEMRGVEGSTTRGIA